jgi:polysaccharide pyruvyl transferase WcaK-like protein
MKKISVFDTTISDYNLGNQIIMESVYKHLHGVFPEDFFFKVPYMEITRHTISYLKRSDLILFGGTNSLSGRMESYKQWDLNIVKSFMIKDVILMGIGWWQYETKTSLYTRFLLKNVLTKKYYHSVRDSHTKEKLEEIGIIKVLNTGCPTLWDLTPEHCKTIPTKKGSGVVMTFTDYNKDHSRDTHLLNVLRNRYSKIYYWIQGEGDLDYLRELNAEKDVQLINPNLESFDQALSLPDVDYVGTRLHAGIRALQKGRRAIIIGIDNRAIEMHRDFNLPVLNQKDMGELDQRIMSGSDTAMQLPVADIMKWKEQFR